MIKREYCGTREDGVNLVKTYSDIGVMIENLNGVRFCSAIDPEGTMREYFETSEKIQEYQERSLDYLGGNLK